jgi:drug/metabolite transporter (DMT)-like permease
MPDLLRARWVTAPVLSLLALGVLGTGVAYAVMSAAAGRFGATRASATTFLIPAVALVLGVVFRGERVAPLSIAGGVVCVTGAWIMRREVSRTKPAAVVASSPAT